MHRVMGTNSSSDSRVHALNHQSILLQSLRKSEAQRGQGHPKDTQLDPGPLLSLLFLCCLSFFYRCLLSIYYGLSGSDGGRNKIIGTRFCSFQLPGCFLYGKVQGLGPVHRFWGQEDLGSSSHPPTSQVHCDLGHVVSLCDRQFLLYETVTIKYPIAGKPRE